MIVEAKPDELSLRVTEELTKVPSRAQREDPQNGSANGESLPVGLNVRNRDTTVRYFDETKKSLGG